MSEEAADVAVNRITVYLRVRPTTDEERAQITRRTYGHILSDIDKTPGDPKKLVVVEQSGKQYQFDKVFREDTKQKDIFDECALPAIQNLLDGYCGAVLAYGQTGTGKTHTMQGTREDKGVIYRCADHLFRRIKADTGSDYAIKVSFVQIYLDKLQDMFKPDAPEVNINPDSERVDLPDITSKTVRSTEDFIEAYLEGNKHRVTRATNMNPTSSRGHAAFIVHMKCTPKGDGDVGTKIGKLVLVDLAGYERFAQTGVEGGIAMEEAKKINHSLLALGSVVNALAAAAEKGAKGSKDHIPFRNAKLTRLLKDCLGGTSKTAIICTIGPLDKYKQESLGTLYFGFRAMAVKVNANVRTVFDPAKYLESLKQNFGVSQEVIFQMARWWRRTAPKDYAAYCAQYGKPTERDLDSDAAPIDNNDEEAEIPKYAAPIPAASFHSGAAPLPPGQVSDVGDRREAVLAEAGAVRQGWNQELTRLKRQAEEEDMQLRARHMAEEAQMQQRGANADAIRRLREAQAQEIEMARMTANEERQGVLAVREKEEVGVLLTGCVASEVLTGQVGHRVNYICDFLKDTCQTKNEVVANLISLVVRREGEIQNLELAQSLAAAQLVGASAFEQGPSRDQRQVQDLKDEVMSLRMVIDEQAKALQDNIRQQRSSQTGTASQPRFDRPEAPQAETQAFQRPSQPTVPQSPPQQMQQAPPAVPGLFKSSGGGSTPRRPR